MKLHVSIGRITRTTSLNISCLAGRVFVSRDGHHWHRLAALKVATRLAKQSVDIIQRILPNLKD